MKGFPDARHIVYDPLSSSALLDAHEQTHGVRILPRFHFDRAEVVVSFDADFLGTWISPVEYTADYRAGRDLEAKRVSYHVQFEPRMSVIRQQGRPAFCGCAGRDGSSAHPPGAENCAQGGSGAHFQRAWNVSVDSAFLDELADRLWHARGRSLIVCGSE